IKVGVVLNDLGIEMNDQFFVEFSGLAPSGTAVASEVVVDECRLTRTDGPEHADERMSDIRAPEQLVEISLMPVDCVVGREVNLVDPLAIGEVKVGIDVAVLKRPGELRTTGQDIGSVAAVKQGVDCGRAGKRICLAGDFSG